MRLLEIYRRALEVVDPFPSTRLALGSDLRGPVAVMAAGKAAVPMLRGVLDGVEVSGGILVTKQDHLEGFDHPLIRCMEAGHPVPDRRSLEAGKLFLEFARRGPKEVVFCLSGGASALLELPVEGMSLEQLQELSRQLLNSGAAIEEINLVRKHLSLIKGGQLGLALSGSRLTTLLLSDVVGAGPEMIGSGPTLGDPSTVAQAEEIMSRYRLQLPGEVQFRETPTEVPGSFKVVADNRLLVQAATEAAGEFQVRPWPRPLLGSVEEAARELAGAARALSPGELLVAGGELTLEIPVRAGLGGRCQHLALLLAGEFHQTDLQALVGASDGTDGPTDAAGAWVDGRTWSAQASKALESFDSYRFFQQNGQAVMTGPTGTNVNDLVLIVAGQPS